MPIAWGPHARSRFPVQEKRGFFGMRVYAMHEIYTYSEYTPIYTE